MSTKESRLRPQGNPAPGGLIFRSWPSWLEIPEDAASGDIFSYAQDVPVEGYFFRRGPRAGAYVQGYTRHIERYYIVPEYFKPRPPPPIPEGHTGSWLPLPVYMEHKYSEWEFFEIQDPIYRKREGKDLIETSTLFIWHTRLPDYSLHAMGASEIAVVRVWILLYNSNTDEYFVFCRTRSLLGNTPPEFRASLKECYKAHVSEGYFDRDLGRAFPSIYEEVKDWAENHTDYVEVREILAWTVWNVPRGKSPADREVLPAKTLDTGRQESPKRSRRAKRKTRLFIR